MAYLLILAIKIDLDLYIDKKYAAFDSSISGKNARPNKSCILICCIFSWIKKDAPVNKITKIKYKHNLRETVEDRVWILSSLAVSLFTTSGIKPDWRIGNINIDMDRYNVQVPKSSGPKYLDMIIIDRANKTLSKSLSRRFQRMFLI